MNTIKDYSDLKNALDWGIAIYSSLNLSPSLVQTGFFPPYTNAAFVEKGRAEEEETLKRDGEKAVYTHRGTN